MDKIIDKHDYRTAIYAGSKMIERGAYYGLRAILILYMIDETMGMSKSEAFGIYGFVTTAIIGSQIIGAIIGDLLIGDKSAVILGGLLQAIGAFILSVSSITALYIGLGLVVLGGGLFTPNVSAKFGRIYLNKDKLLDGGFTIFYTLINVGAFLGIITLGYFGESNFKIGFIFAGSLFIVAALLPLIDKKPKEELQNYQSVSLNKRIVIITAIMIILGLFWVSYDISNYGVFEIQMQLSENSLLDIPKSLWSGMNSYFLIPIAIIASIIWSYYYLNRLKKLIAGFLIAGISFGLLLFLPDEVNDNHLFVFFLFVFLISVAEILIAPIIQSIITKYCNPKYLAILMAINFLPIKLITLSLVFFNDKLYDNSNISIWVGASTMLICGALLVISNKLVNKTVFKN